MSISAFKQDEKAYIEWYDGEKCHATEFEFDVISAICTSGSNDSAVEQWQKNLNFIVPKEIAIKHLKEYGAWDDEELNNLTEIELAQKILWICAWDISESSDE